MSTYSPRSNGLGYAPAYQVAGKPYLTGSLIESEAPSSTFYSRKQYAVSFPLVTKYVEVTNYCSSSELAVYFDTKEAAGQSGPIMGLHYFVIPPTSTGVTGSFKGHIKCKELFITAAPQGGLTGSIVSLAGTLMPGPVNAGSFGVYAELTHIAANEMYPLTGSGINTTTYSDSIH